MPPPGGNKRKRGDRTYSDDNYSRPSPHRPGNLHLAQHNSPQSSNYGRDYQDYNRGRGGRRPSRGGRGGNHSHSNSFGSTDMTASQPRQMTVRSPEPVVTNTQAAVPPPFLQPVLPLTEYDFSIISDGVCENWQEHGREEILQKVTEFAEQDNESSLSMLIQELLYAVLCGRLSPEDGGELVKQICDTESVEDPTEQVTPVTPTHAILLDLVSIAFEAHPTMPIDRLAVFIAACGLTPEQLRYDLDATLLEKLDLIRSTFSRMGIRKQTNILYRQANFNLMREESEGFAKLMTELFTTSGSEPPSGDVVEESVERVKAMIGAFDLDVGRSLDVVLDVFGAVLVKQFRFFVKFLRASPWWPRSASSKAGAFNVGGLPMWAMPGTAEWRLTDAQKSVFIEASLLRDQQFWPLARERGLSAFYQLGRTAATTEMVEKISDSTDSFFDIWVRDTKTLPPSGNRDAAQLLGFKLRFYSTSLARDGTDVLPDNLIYLSALLIKIGFISLNDLYPHIWRMDEGMEELKQQKLKEKADRERASKPGAGARNALLMAGALADDTLPVPTRLKESSTRAGTPAKEVETEKSAAKEPVVETPDQKVLLLKSLLAIGALPEALFILGRFPWLIDLYPDLPEYIHRILHHSLHQVYAEFQPLNDRPSLHEQAPTYETDIPGLVKGQVRTTATPVRKVLRWALLDRNDSSDGTDYVFYWDEWADNIPVCRSIDDIFILCDTLLPLVGVKIGHDPALVLKLARIGKGSLKDDPSDSNRSRWLSLIQKYLLPALSLTKSNAGVVNEVFELMNHFPINTRYLMYLEWSTGRTSRNADVKVAFDLARAETKDVLKRISKTNVRPMARALAKIAFANPHIVITTALAQIEVYDSIAEVFVEGARYFTDLGYDVLTWAMISSMARAGRSRTQEGGIFTSRWLSALAQFAGKIYRRYSMMKPGPILQYVAEQLDKSNSTDLKMLEQIVVAMGGIAVDTGYNDSQLQAMGGGPLLQSQTILQLLDRRHDSKLTSRRLMKSLQDAGLVGKFLLSMAQLRQACVFEEQDVPLKVIGNTYDEIHRVMVQYLDLLRANLSTAEFAVAIPDIVQLLIEYEIRPEIAFWICRPVLAKRIVDSNREQKMEEDEVKANGDVEMSDQLDGELEEDGEAVETEETEEAITPSDVNSTLELGTIEKASLSPIPPSELIWHPVMHELMTAIEYQLPSDVVDLVGNGFYCTFWQLSLYDITIPGKAYEDELSRQHKRIAAISADRSDVSLSGTRKKEAEKKQIGELIENLLAENKSHLKAFAESKARLQREKEQWFMGKAKINEALNTALLEHCFLPRMLSSPLDAYFCFKFIKFLHGAGTANFRTLGLYDLIFRPARLGSLIFMCTSKEADNLGRFVNEVLKDLSRWHSSKTTYEREAFGMRKNLPGFAMKVEAGKAVSLLDFESFRRILAKWHGNFFTALQKCLGDSEYMHVRNAISILRSVSSIFPAINWQGVALQKSVDQLRESDKEDLKVASQALLGALHRREKSWVMPQAFRQGNEKTTEPPKVEVAKAEAVKAEAVKTDSKVEPSIVKNEEDGEVDDTVMDDVKEEKKEVKPEPVKPRPVVQNGSATPTRIQPEKRETKPEKQHSLPRRLSPPRHSLPPSLPTRPEADRNGLREGRMPTRPPVERPRDTRDYRAEPGYGERHRREDERYGREHERLEVGKERLDVPRDRPPRQPKERDSRDTPRREERRPEDVRRPEEQRRSGQDETRRPPEEPPRDDTRRAPDEPRRIEEGRRQEKPTSPIRASIPEPMAINPERAALINADMGRPSRSSRPSSPRRDEDRRRHERDDRRVESSRQSLPATRPTNPRESKVPDQEVGRLEQDRSIKDLHRNEPETRRNESNSRADLESRLSRNEADGRTQEFRRVDDSHRAEQERRERPEIEIPSGPRTRPTGPSRRGPDRPPTLDRPPTGPNRHNRSVSQQEPVTPVIDTSGVHPSRLNQIEPSTINSPPAGPRNAAPANAPSGPSPAPRGPVPTERNRNNRHPLAAVNNTLAAAQGTSIRGRGGRQSTNSFPHGSPPTGPRPDLPPQQDLFAAPNPNDVPISTRPPSGRDRQEEDRRSNRGRHDEDDRGQRKDDHPRRENQEDNRRGGYKEDNRKHNREDSGSYNGGSRGSRAGGEIKRPRRGA